ncbi:hypothetical protein LCGC14_1579530 [marine sediment metagenome]|uniref:Uncharacterized protein n=1 Tax=marine sediment metagenome TaxID=412755 RepID=A0A0F9IHH0_9ZZZZ
MRRKLQTFALCERVGGGPLTVAAGLRADQVGTIIACVLVQRSMTL